MPEPVIPGLANFGIELSSKGFWGVKFSFAGSASKVVENSVFA
jgi:hypothetical protein